MSQSTKPIDSVASPEARARRLASLRGLMRLSRHAFAKRYGANARTLQNWEYGKSGGISVHAAKKLVIAVQASGITGFTLEWLMYGIGEGPLVSEHLYRDNLHDAVHTHSFSPEHDQESQHIIDEILLFRQHYFPQETVEYIVKDDAMAPRYLLGDHLAGVRHYGKAIINTLDWDCIVHTAQGDTLLRTVKPSQVDGCYTLRCQNPQTTIVQPMLYDVELVSAAPVVWVRRKHIK